MPAAHRMTSYWEIFSNAGTTTKIGQSTFHLSCSDIDMNGPEDCGKVQGDGKDKTGFLNNWILEGLSGNGKTLDCTTTPSFPTAGACTVYPTAQPNCATEGKPKTLEFKYTGDGCAASNNPQSGKAVCTPTGTLDGLVTVRAAGNSNFSKDVYTVGGSPVAENGTFTITFNGADLKADSYVEVMDSDGDKELNKIHTSCSQALAVGDKFGSLTLVGFNGATGGTEVKYGYTVTNTGDRCP